MPDGPDGVKATVRRREYERESGCLLPSAAAGTVTIAGIVVDQPGSGYSTAPKVVIRDGTIFDPINTGGSGATATATLAIQRSP